MLLLWYSLVGVPPQTQEHIILKGLMELVAVPWNKFQSNLIKFNLITLNLLNRLSIHTNVQELEEVVSADVNL